MVAISPISFGLGNLSVAKWVTLLSVCISISVSQYIVYMTISIIGAWQVFANVGITFERMNIFTCGKKQMVAWIKAVTGGGLGPCQGPNSLHDNLYNRGLAGVRLCGHTYVGITFERMNIFTCGKKQMVAWIKAVTRR